MTNLYADNLKRTVFASQTLKTLSPEKKSKALFLLRDVLRKRKSSIVKSNKADVSEAKKNRKDEAFLHRLTLGENDIEHIALAVEEVAMMKDPVAKVLEERYLKDGVLLKKISVPLGVIAVIYESRPNVTIDAYALAFKSGNAIVLKGGSEAIRTNRVLSDCIKISLRESGLLEEMVCFFDTTDRSITPWLLKQYKDIDVVIPRGGLGLISTVRKYAKIPLLYHAQGGARIYVDQSADIDMATHICVNAKTQRPATCNSLDTLLVHATIAETFIPNIVQEFLSQRVEVRGDASVCRIAKNQSIEAAQKVRLARKKDWETEWLSLTVNIKVVSSCEEAIDHIQTYTKHHTEGIISSDQLVIDRFISSIDAASIMINCSSRLHDGGVYGLGAEMGISTGKLHARGPVGIHELMTYQWVAIGNGQKRV